MAAGRWGRRAALGLAAVVVVGTAAAPAAGASTRAAGTPVGTRTTASPGFSFHADGYEIHDIGRASYPYVRSVPVARTDTELHDADGVRVTVVAGRAYDHPVAQAQYGLANVASYQITRDLFYLERAMAQAERLLLRATRVKDASYFPYPFDFDPHGLVDERLPAPWYSAMAQGQALSLFVRLAEATGQPRWRAAADATFETFLRPHGTATPWTVSVDAAGYLWLEEYAGGEGDHTFNGHMFAAWGLWDYWRITRDVRAAQLWDGALTTVAVYAPQLRQPGWISSYCLSHPWSVVATYHQIHIAQLATLYAMSHAPVLARLSEQYLDDYPTPAVRGTVRFTAGRYTAYRFSWGGKVLARKTLTLARPSTAPADQRTRVQGHGGVWYRITKGSLQGFYLQERPGAAVMAGSSLTSEWSPARPGTLPAHVPVTGRTFAADGRRTGVLAMTPPAATPVTVSRTSLWNGVRSALVADGSLRGYWVPVSAISFT